MNKLNYNSVCLSGYLKIDEQRKCKAHKAAKKGLQRLLKG